MHEEIQELINEIRTPEEIISESNPREELEELIRGMNFEELLLTRLTLEEMTETGGFSESEKQWRAYADRKRKAEE